MSTTTSRCTPIFPSANSRSSASWRPGKSVSEIAHELSLSVKTVSTYRTRVLEKMCFRSNADITSYAVRNGLVN